MLSKPSTMTLRNYIDELASHGRYSFALEEARAALGISPNAVRLAVNRLVKAGVLVSPARGFYVAVPPEYRRLGCPPADQFLPQLMAFLGLPYYVGLLSAAQYHGAAQQRPQEFQVMLAAPRRAIRCGHVRVAFVVRKQLQAVPVQSVNTLRGTITVSTPEATALDLIGYPQRVGGLDQMVTVLADLAESIDSERLSAAAASAPVSWAQRLGYLLDGLGAESKTGSLKAYVRQQAHEMIPLQPGASCVDTPRDPTWKIWANATPEVDQ